MSGDSAEGERFVVVAETRRRWTRAEKQAIVAECCGGRASVSAVARKHNIAPNLLFRWRSDFGVGPRKRGDQPSFVAVALSAAAPAGGAGALSAGRGLIEIELAGGRRVRVDGSIDAGVLRRVIEVLEGR